MPKNVDRALSASPGSPTSFPSSDAILSAGSSPLLASSHHQQQSAAAAAAVFGLLPPSSVSKSLPVSVVTPSGKFTPIILPSRLLWTFFLLTSRRWYLVLKLNNSYLTKIYKQVRFIIYTIDLWTHSLHFVCTKIIQIDLKTQKVPWLKSRSKFLCRHKA